MDLKLKDRVALITGAADGLGKALSLQCAAAGATVILLDKTVPGLEKVYDQIVATGSPEPAAYPMNLEGAEWKDYEQLAATLMQEFGRLDVLIHNAAHFHGLTPLANFDLREWARTLHVNLTAPYLLTRCCLELLGQPAQSNLIFVSDEAGEKAKAYWGAYGVSKHGLDGLAGTFAEELESSTINVHRIDPGPMSTAMRIKAFPSDEPGTIDAPDMAAAKIIDLLARAE